MNLHVLGSVRIRFVQAEVLGADIGTLTWAATGKSHWMSLMSTSTIM
jgi:hypothetical protein